MKIDIKKTRVYIISPGIEKYRSRVLTVFENLLDKGFTNIIFFRSVTGPNNTASLTNTVLEIFKQEMKKDDPFIILEDDCNIFNQYDIINIPDRTDILYLGVSIWSYPYPIETLYHQQRPNIFKNCPSTVQSYNDQLTEIKGMTGGHAILYISREFIRTFINQMNKISQNIDNCPHDLLFSSMHNQFNVYGLKKPMFYQDSNLGGQENVTKLTFNGDCYDI
jgi:hypothetical protein